MSRILLALVSISLIAVAAVSPQQPRENRWWRGNTHTHTLWSDGDGAPELVVDWYAEHGYDFLVLSDHNQLQEGERWFPIRDEGRLTETQVEGLRERFGGESVAVRETDQGQAQMRLVPLAELEERFEMPGRFELIKGEEITSHWNTLDEPPRKLPVHINVVNLAEYVPPRGGDSVIELLNATLDAVSEQSERLGRPMLAHLNHPNFGWGVTWQEVASMRAERFFEVYNGHHSVRNEGDETRPSTERMWDLANTARITELGLPPLYGVAVDDAHNYYGNTVSQPGRGWVMVHAEQLDADSIVAAMRRGDFYSSSGVELESITTGDGRYEVRIAPADGVEFTTRFLGTRMKPAGLGPAGQLLFETTANPAVYDFLGGEIYVRAVVESSRLHPNPYKRGDREMAWTQPVER